MGREVKRVPLNFDWPLGEVWSGFLAPPDGEAPCQACVRDGRPTGYSRLGNAIYSLADGFGTRSILPVDTKQLNEGEVLFMAAMSRAVAPKYRCKRPYVTGPVTDRRMLCYDIIRHLAKTLRLPMKKTFFCENCKGKCRVTVDPVQRRKYRNWRPRKLPEGTGWQVWETVTEGSPITPVFATAEELVEYLCTVGTLWDRQSSRSLPSRENAAAFVRGGWVPSAIMDNGTFLPGIEAATLLHSKVAE